MRRVGILIVLPLLAFALEKVNLIKDHSFEKNSEVWKPRVYGSTFPSVALANRYDSGNSLTGDYSGSGDTRPEPANPVLNHSENALITQGFCIQKTISDIDSLFVSYSVILINDDLTSSYFSPILLHINANSEDFWKVGYVLKPTDIGAQSNPPYKYLEQIYYPDDTLWHTLAQDIYRDIEEWMIPPLTQDASVDSIILKCSGNDWPPWRGQKVFFDDVRLMGYADYDVGIKEITSVTETIPYTPAALIKNFGREPADFQVFAEILQGETQVYKDSIDWSLPSDTEDTVSFSTFNPPDTGAYLLRIYTVMDPDESDADDEQTKELHFEAIAEPVTHPQLLTLDVRPTMTTPLQVSYSLPNGHTGALTLFDLSGRRVDAKRQVRGYGTAAFSADLTAGVYIVRLEASGTTLSRKVVVVE